MLRPIDRFIAAIRRGEGEELLFVTGQPIRLRSGQQMKVLLAQPVRADQIQAILKDVVPPEIDYGFTSDGDATFTFDADGPVTVHLRRYQGRLDALLRPAQPGAPAAQPGPAAASKGATTAPPPTPPPAPPPAPQQQQQQPQQQQRQPIGQSKVAFPKKKKRQVRGGFGNECLKCHVK